MEIIIVVKMHSDVIEQMVPFIGPEAMELARVEFEKCTGVSYEEFSERREEGEDGYDILGDDIAGSDIYTETAIEDVTSLRTLALSTAHITQEASNQLTEGSLPLTVFPKGNYGYWLCVPEPTEIPDGLPVCLHDVLVFAIARSMDWIMLDCDGPSVDGLPSYLW